MRRASSGSAALDKLHGTLDVGKQHRHLLALAFQRAAAAQNSLGEWLRRVALGRRLGHRWCGGTGQSRAATAAKLRGRCVFETTTGTDTDEPGAALAAKSAVRRILGGASRTAHPSRSLFQIPRPSGDVGQLSIRGPVGAQAGKILSPHSGALCNRTRHPPAKAPGGSPADPSYEVGSPQASFASRLVAMRRTLMTQHRAETLSRLLRCTLDFRVGSNTAEPVMPDGAVCPLLTRLCCKTRKLQGQFFSRKSETGSNRRFV